MNNRVDETMAKLFNAEELETLLTQLRAQAESLENAPYHPLPGEFELTGPRVDEIIENLTNRLRSAHGPEICLVILPSLIQSVRRGQSG